MIKFRLFETTEVIKNGVAYIRTVMTVYYHHQGVRVIQ